MKLLIIVSGGVVQNIVATEPVEIYLVDHDNLKERGESVTSAQIAQEPSLICNERLLMDVLDEELAEYQNIEED
jgi:hypothetical protein